MPKGRQKLPGSFQDELGGVIDRVAPAKPKERARPDEAEKNQVSNTVELNDRLFEKAWRKDR